ncbi:MAG: helix-turn-helix transcriptional regulator [Gallionella sp.]|nr:helix-turn-helix transcriptional regulator [Gallionella sp.]
MDLHNVPQEGNKTLGGHKKAVYARDSGGHIVAVASKGWEVEEIVTSQALEELQVLTEAARQNVLNSLSSPLEYWMNARRMDLHLLAQTTGIWRWRIRRHFRPEIFARLSPRVLARYAEALGLTIKELQHLP